jgi:hypothetical protein
MPPSRKAPDGQEYSQSGIFDPDFAKLESGPYSAPHLANARQVSVDCLVSLDHQHMIDVRQPIEENLDLRILLPGELLSLLSSSKQS